MATDAKDTTARGLYLKLLRRSRRWSQQEVATAIGATLNTVSRAELGIHNPGKYLAPLLQVLNGSLEDWLALEDASLEEGLQRAHDRIDRMHALRKMTPSQIRDMQRRRNGED